jgi:hypothetical protein
MCIIIYKNVDSKRPTEKVLAACHKSNKDGFGVMWRVGNKVNIIKGTLSIDGIYKVCDKIPKNAEAAYHFRFATHGQVCAENCHPFPLSGKLDALRRTAGVFDTGLVHNGVISGFGYRNSSTLSDTMNFIKYVERASQKIYTYDRLKKFIKDEYGKFIVFTPGWTYTYGTFVKDGDLEYSNTGYKTYCDLNKNYARNVPLVQIVDPKDVAWVGKQAKFKNLKGELLIYKNIYIFAEDKYYPYDMRLVKEDIDILLAEGEIESYGWGC